jgi:hypothetical protein
MPKTHTRILTMTAAFALATLVAAAPALAQATQPPSQPAKPMQAEKAPATTLQGDLLSVDPEAKTVTIKPASGADQVFKYGDDTKVIGGDKGVAGLATMKGSKVTVTFKTEGRDRIATQIEVHPKAGG